MLCIVVVKTQGYIKITKYRGSLLLDEAWFAAL